MASQIFALDLRSALSLALGVLLAAPMPLTVGDDYIVATQGWVARKSEIAMFYRSNKRGTFNIIQDRITEYWMYVDLEAAVDKFYAEFYEEAEMAKAIALEEETQNISNEEII